MFCISGTENKIKTLSELFINRGLNKHDITLTFKIKMPSILRETITTRPKQFIDSNPSFFVDAQESLF